MKKRIKYFSKPALVTFCRYLSHEKLLFPYRIRFASFRSKQNLWDDITRHFNVSVNGNRKNPSVLLTINHRTLKTVPEFRYQDRTWYVDDKVLKLPDPNRALTAKIRYEPVTVTFWPSKQIVSDFVLSFPRLNTQTSANFEETRCLPFCFLLKRIRLLTVSGHFLSTLRRRTSGPHISLCF